MLFFGSVFRHYHVKKDRLPCFTLKVCELDSESEDVRREQWRIGPGGIQRRDITLIGAIHVSAGTWMPIMQLNRYIF